MSPILVVVICSVVVSSFVAFSPLLLFLLLFVRVRSPTMFRLVELLVVVFLCVADVLVVVVDFVFIFVFADLLEKKTGYRVVADSENLFS